MSILSQFFAGRRLVSLSSGKAAIRLSLAILALVTGTTAHAEQKPLKIGIRGGVGEQIWEVAADVARQNGLPVELVVITGTASPNEALNNGDLDANSFQHTPYLEDQIKQRGYRLVSVGDTIFAPLAFYSKKVTSLDKLGDGAKIGIPNDPSNETRALVLLQNRGLIRLRDRFDPAKDVASLDDITSNPKKFEFVESTSVVLARSLEDVDAAAIVTSFASQAGLHAARDGIALEGKENNPFVNIITVREQDKDAPWVPTLVKAYQSPQVRAFIEKEYQGTIIPAF